MNYTALSLKTTSATKLYANLDIPETHELIVRYSEEDNITKVMDIFRSNQRTLEDRMLHNRRTLQEITEMRKDSIKDNVRYIFSPYLIIPLLNIRCC